MTRRARSYVTRIAVAALSVGLALVFTLALQSNLDPTVVPLFLAAVTVSALYGGMGSALLATALSALAIHYFFLAPLSSLVFDAEGLRRLWLFRLGLFLVTALLITLVAAARRRAEKQLRRRERELADFFENASVGLHWMGPDGQIVRANQAELDLLGYTREEYVDHHIASFHADMHVIDDVLRRLKNGETLENYEARLRCKDGSIKHVIMSANVLWEGGKFIHTRCFTRDITDRKRLEEELRDRVAELAEVDRRKDEFLGTLGHELRNPLGAIRTSLETMRLRGAGDATADRARTVAERKVQHIARLLDDLLDVSGIAQGKIKLRHAPFELAAVIGRAVETVRPLIAERSQVLSISLPREPLALEGDATRIEQVLTNLLNNAVKFTDLGGAISVAAERNGEEAVVRVKDTGAGIPGDSLLNVFDLYSQSERSLDRPQQGLGIGLPLVRSLVAMHRGQVEAHSDGPGKGSEFVVRLPFRAKRARSRAASTPASPDPAPSPPRKVLVVDDDIEVARGLAELLELWGHQVQLAHSGTAALQMARADEPEVVFVDIGLPGMDGFAVARTLRAQAANKDLLIVALTGYGHEAHRRQSRDAGIDHHLVKPVEIESLRGLLASPADRLSSAARTETVLPQGGPQRDS